MYKKQFVLNVRIVVFDTETVVLLQKLKNEKYFVCFIFFSFSFLFYGFHNNVRNLKMKNILFFVFFFISLLFFMGFAVMLEIKN